MKRLAIICGSLFFLFFLFILSIYAGFWGELPSKKELSNRQLDKATLITDHSGAPLGALYEVDRVPITYEDISPYLIDALIATEDVRFYEHDGVDTRSLFRVFFKTILLQDASSGGGSTLTQQLAKNLYPRKKAGMIGLLAAKIRESVIASRLEDLYTKEELLEKYLNTVPFSDNTFGVESASRHFFSKSAKDLSVEEAATLIGTLKATHTYNPRLFAERSLTRRNTVLHQMLKYDKLNQENYEQAKQKELLLRLNPLRIKNSTALYFKEQVRKELEKWAAAYQEHSGETVDIYTDGLEVITTLDLEMQQKAEKAMARHLAQLQNDFERSYGKGAPWAGNTALSRSVTEGSEAYKKLQRQGLSSEEIREALKEKKERQVFNWNGDHLQTMSVQDSITHYLKLLNTGWVSLEPRSGAVKTWIGGVDYRYLQYDHVTQSKRQVGSVFKPIVYATAIEQGVPPCKHYDLRKVAYENLEDWTPDNASEEDDRNYMNYSLEYALSRSVNTVAVKVLEDAGIDSVIAVARKMGITSPLPEVPSLALGTAELSVLEMATAYSAFLNEGKSSSPYFIEEIKDASGNVLYKHEPEDIAIKQPAFSAETAALVLEMLKSTVDEGTARRIRERYNISSDLAGKTGTTQNNKDGWFVGLNNDLVSVTWVGLDDQRLGFPSTQMGQGANSALPMFALWWKDLQRSDKLQQITTATFSASSEEVLEALDCEPVKKDGFFKRLFKNPNKTKRRNFKGLSSGRK